jgi:hypothetical protein
MFENVLLHISKAAGLTVVGLLFAGDFAQRVSHPSSGLLKE